MNKGVAVGLPPRPFLYTLDQVASLLSVALPALTTRWIHFNGRTVGMHRKDTIRAVDIGPLGGPPEWRVQEEELVRWMKKRGIRFYERTLTA